MFVNAALVVAKLAAGIVGHSYALVADAVESSTDIFASLIVWGGLHVSAQPADESHPGNVRNQPQLRDALRSACGLGGRDLNVHQVRLSAIVVQGQQRPQAANLIRRQQFARINEEDPFSFGSS